MGSTARRDDGVHEPGRPRLVLRDEALGMMQTPVTPRLRYWTWERLARIAIFTQVIITIAIAGYFAVVTDQQNAVLASQTIASEASNKAIISEIRADLSTHAQASADRTCGVVRLLDYLANSSTIARSEAELAHIAKLVDKACLYVPPHVADLSTVHHGP